jgi:hypothetical protein
VQRRRVDGRSGAFNATLAVVGGRHVELVLVSVEHDRAGNETDDAGVFFNPEQTGSGRAADESERDTVAVFVRRDDGSDERVRPGVLVDVGGVNLKLIM